VHPDTGFGYIRKGASIAQSGEREIAAFVEKPNLETAREYVANGDYVWNSGMFCFRADALIAAAQDACPEVLQAAQSCHASAISHDSPVEYARDAFLAMQ